MNDNINTTNQDDLALNLEIKPQNHLFELHLDDVWRYRDLLILFVKRDIVSFYKQTVLGRSLILYSTSVRYYCYNFCFG